MKLGEIAEFLGGELTGDPDIEISGVSGVNDAVEGDITFATDEKNLKLAINSGAYCIMLKESDPALRKAQIKVDDPLYAFALLLGHFNPGDHGPLGVSGEAHVAKGASFGVDVTVHPLACISEGASIGDGTVIYPGVFIGRGVTVGKKCIIYPNVVIREGTLVGDRVILHPGVVIGADGFGYVLHGGRHFKIPQVGGVVIEDEVEIGANSTVDRATTGATVIGKGTKIDNLVQLAHNVKVGENSVIVAQVGVGGSTEIGSYVMIGGQVAISDHASVEDGTALAARTGVMGHLKKGVYAGAPAMPHRDFFRSCSIFAKLPELQKRVQELERKLSEKGG